MHHRSSRWLTAAFAVALLTACTQPVSPPPPVPPPQAESIPLPPISPVEQVFRPGYWNWDGAGYRWVPGAYQPRTGQSIMWRQGYWLQTANGWAWQPAGWM